MTSEELTCDVVERILRDLEETIETLQKIKKKFKYFHPKTFSLYYTFLTLVTSVVRVWE